MQNLFKCLLTLSCIFYFTFWSNICIPVLGSGEQHTAYIYGRVGRIPSVPGQAGYLEVDVPGRGSMFCDPLWFGAIQQAVGPTKDLMQIVAKQRDTFLNKGRDLRSTRRIELQPQAAATTIGDKSSCESALLQKRCVSKF